MESEIERIRTIAAELSLLAVRMGHLVEALAKKPSLTLIDDKDENAKILPILDFQNDEPDFP